MAQWQEILMTIDDKINHDEKLLDISLMLAQASQDMAEERRNKRFEYFERSVSNETQLDVAVSKVEALLWIDRLIFHYWRATACMAEFQSIHEQK